MKLDRGGMKRGSDCRRLATLMTVACFCAFLAETLTAGPVDKVNVRRTGGTYTATFSILGDSVAATAVFPEGFVAGGLGCSTDAECDDGLFCNGVESCTDFCVPGEPPVCDDGNPDTIDTCNEGLDSCEHNVGTCQPRIFALVVPEGITLNIYTVTQDGVPAAFDPDIPDFALLNDALEDAGYLGEGTDAYTLRVYLNTCNYMVKSELEIIFSTKGGGGAFVELPQFMVATTTEDDLNAAPLTEVALAKEQIVVLAVPAVSHWGMLALLLSLLVLARTGFAIRNRADDGRGT